VNPEKIYVEIPGELGWREYPLRELVRLWRTAQLPHNAVFQNDLGEWRPIAELVDPIIERQTRAAASGSDNSSAQVARRPSRHRRWLWAGAGVSLIALALGVWSILHDRYAAWKVARHDEREAVLLERRAHVEELVRIGEIVPGMTLEEVRRSWGEPKTKKVAADGIRQQWIYRHHAVTFENGVATGIEETASQRK
jgi:hypothetical protein